LVFLENIVIYEMRKDIILKLVTDREKEEDDLASQPTMSRLENNILSMEENIENPNHLEDLDPDLEKNLAISSKDYAKVVDQVRKEFESQNFFSNHLQVGIL